MTDVSYNPIDEPLVISNSLHELLLSTGDYSNLVGLYLFYYGTAKWQRSNQIYATINYTAKGLNWGEDKVREKKKKLTELGLIENIQTKGDSGQFDKQYIKINFIWGRTALGILPGSVKTQTNALSVSKGSALSVTNNIVEELKQDTSTQTIRKRTILPKEETQTLIQRREEKYIGLAEQLAQIVRSAKNVHITSSRIRSWSSEIYSLIETQKINPQRVSRVLDWYSSHIGKPFIPVVLSGSALCEKFVQLEAAIDRGKTEDRSTYKRAASEDISRDQAETVYGGNVIQLQNIPQRGIKR